MPRIANAMVSDYREEASWRERYMSNKPSMTGLYEKCCHGDLQSTWRSIWVSWEGQGESLRGSRVFSFVFTCCRGGEREGEGKRERNKQYPFLVKNSCCTERYKIKIADSFFHLSAVILSGNSRKIKVLMYNDTFYLIH